MVIYVINVFNDIVGYNCVRIDFFFSQIGDQFVYITTHNL